MNTKNLLIILIILIVGCTSETNKKSTKISKIKNKVAKIKRDSVLIPEFEIVVELSERAEHEIREKKESIIVQAYFIGIPKDTLNKEYQKYGRITIGAKGIELWNSNTAKFKNVKVSKEKYDELYDTNFEVLINITTGRHTSVYNLIKSEILQKSIDTIKGKSYVLKGELIKKE